MEQDPTKNLVCYVSFDMALDREAMGTDYYSHFGLWYEGRFIKYGNRDKRLIKLLPGKQASEFHLKPLTLAERVACDSLSTAEQKWIRALSYALVKVELGESLAGKNITVFAKHTDSGFDDEQLNYLSGLVGAEALYEVGAVAYSRSRLDPFGQGFAPLPATSPLVLERVLQYHAAIQYQNELNTKIKEEASTSDTSTETNPPAP